MEYAYTKVATGRHCDGSNSNKFSMAASYIIMQENNDSSIKGTSA
mgnify:CR=1 FL=1